MSEVDRQDRDAGPVAVGLVRYPGAGPAVNDPFERVDLLHITFTSYRGGLQKACDEHSSSAFEIVGQRLVEDLDAAAQAMADLTGELVRADFNLVRECVFEVPSATSSIELRRYLKAIGRPKRGRPRKPASLRPSTLLEPIDQNTLDRIMDAARELSGGLKIPRSDWPSCLVICVVPTDLGEPAAGSPLSLDALGVVFKELRRVADTSKGDVEVLYHAINVHEALVEAWNERRPRFVKAIVDASGFHDFRDEYHAPLTPAAEIKRLLERSSQFPGYTRTFLSRLSANTQEILEKAGWAEDSNLTDVARLHSACLVALGGLTKGGGRSLKAEDSAVVAIVRAFKLLGGAPVYREETDWLRFDQRGSDWHPSRGVRLIETLGNVFDLGETSGLATRARVKEACRFLGRDFS